MRIRYLLAAAGICLLGIPSGSVYASNDNTYFDTIVVASESVSVYTSAESGSKKKTTLSADHTAEIEETVTGDDSTVWYQVTVNKKTGFVSENDVLTGDDAEEYLLEEEILYAASASKEPAAVYLHANSTGAVVFQLQEDDAYLVTAIEGDYLAIDGGNDFTGYVLLDDVSLFCQDNLTKTREDLVATALQYVGNPYKWGGTSLTNGIDCSGFTMKIYAMYGITLPHSSRAQAKKGVAVDSSDLLPGDLIFYNRNGKIGHVAIYIGDGKIVHAANKKSGIKISKWNYMTPVAIRRLLY